MSDTIEYTEQPKVLASFWGNYLRCLRFAHAETRAASMSGRGGRGARRGAAGELRTKTQIDSRLNTTLKEVCRAQKLMRIARTEGAFLLGPAVLRSGPCMRPAVMLWIPGALMLVQLPFDCAVGGNSPRDRWRIHIEASEFWNSAKKALWTVVVCRRHTAILFIPDIDLNYSSLKSFAIFSKS